MLAGVVSMGVPKPGKAATDFLVVADAMEEAGQLYHAWLLRSYAEPFGQGLLLGRPAVKGLEWCAGLACHHSPASLMAPGQYPAVGQEVPVELLAVERRAVATIVFRFDGRNWRAVSQEEFQPRKGEWRDEKEGLVVR